MNPVRTLVCFVVVSACGPLLSGSEAAPAKPAPVMFRYQPSHEATAAAGSVELAGMAWRFKTGGAIRSTPAMAEGAVVVGSNDGFLYALDAGSGREKWRFRLGGEASGSPAIVEGRVIVLGGDGTLRCLGLGDGAIVWTLTLGADIPWGDDTRAFDLWLSSPTVVGDTIYIGGGDGKVHAVDRTNGRERWSHPTGHRVRSTPAVSGDTVYVGSFDGHVYALDASTGAERWKFQTGDSVQASPAIAGDLIVVGSRSLAVFALDARTGELKWRRPHSGSWILASAAVAGDKVIVGGSDSHLLEALDRRSGEPIWSVMVGDRVLGSPTVAGGTIAYGAEDFRVYTADLETGLGLSIDATEAAVYSSVVVEGNRLYVGSDDAHVYAFNLRPATKLPSAVDPALLKRAAGTYRTKGGDVFTLGAHQGRCSLSHATYPLAAVLLEGDGSFTCPMLWGLSGRLQGSDGQPASALVLSQFGREVIAARVN